MTDLFLSVFEISVSISLLIGALLLLTPFLNRQYAAKWSYWIWILLAVRLILPFHLADVRAAANYLSQMPAQLSSHSAKNDADTLLEQNIPSEQVGQIVVEIPAQMTVPIAIHSSENRLPFTLLDLTVFIWLTGGFLFLAVHLLSYLYYKKQVLKNGTAIENNYISEQISMLKQELGIRGTLRVIKYTEAASPMIIGFWKPVLILPEEISPSKEPFPSEALPFILKHELVHLKRKDVYKKLLFVLANAIHWFNPLVWIMQREAAITMELSCDERVIQGTNYTIRKAYTETLLSTLYRHYTRKTVLSTQFYGGKQVMKKRFKNILEQTRKKNGASVLICVLVLTASLSALVGCSFPAVTAGIKTNPVLGKNENIPNFPTDTFNDDIPGVQEPTSPEDITPSAAIPQNGQIYGYLSEFADGTATIDLQLWLTPESEGWKPEYNDAAGFEVVDAEGEDITYPLHENCTFSILENHYDPRLELSAEEFRTALSEMEYQVLWIIELEEGKITDISEQYRP